MSSVHAARGGADVAGAVNSICPDSEQQPDPEALERKLFRMLEKRGAKAALEGWRLSTKDEDEGKRCRRNSDASEMMLPIGFRERRDSLGADCKANVGDGELVKRLYSPYQLRSVLQLMGLKQLRAHEVTRLAFEKLGQICQGLEHQWQVEAGQALASEGSSVWLTRRQWIILLTIALSLSDRCRKKHIKDFVMACAIREHRRPMIILFGGTSGCGKSTLASLTASRLGITTVLSTDFVRHLLRREFSKQEAPILYASTYNAGEALDAQVLGAGGACSQGCGEDVAAASRRVLQGYQEQSGFIFDRLARVIASYEERREPLIVEGVHLSMDAMAELMKRHASAIGFMVYISNADKHRERFAVRAKYMALDQRSNRYIKFFDNIRLIQSSQAQEADKILIPKIDNTNVDRSLATIHAIVIKCLRKHYKGRLLWDSEKRQAVYMRKAMEEHQEDAWSSKAMLRTIRSKISKGEVLRRYFADAPGDDSSAGLDSPGRPIQDLSDKSLPASPPSPLRECEAPVPEGACGPAARVHAGIDTRPSRLGGGGHEPGGPPRAAAGQDIQGALQHAALDTAPRVPGIGQEDEVEAGAQVEQGNGKSSGATELGPASVDRKSLLGAGGRTHAATTHEQAPSKASEEHVADPAPPDLGPNSPPAPVAADMSDSWGGDADRFGVDALGTTREPLAPAPPAVAGATWGLADSSLAVGGGGVRRKARPRGGRGKGPPGQQSSLFLQMRLQVVQETGVLEGGGHGRDGESVGVQSRMQTSGRSLCSSRERAPPQDAQSCGPSRVCCDDPSETPPCVVDADHDIVSRSQQQLVQPLVSPSSSSASDEEYDDDDSLSGSDHGRGSPSTASESEGRTLDEHDMDSCSWVPSVDGVSEGGFGVGFGFDDDGLEGESCAQASIGVVRHTDGSQTILASNTSASDNGSQCSDSPLLADPD